MSAHRFDPTELVLDSDIFGPALSRVRHALGVSQKELGSHALVAGSTVATYETQARDPSPEALVGIAVACGVEPWSAAQHGRLLASNMLMTRAAGGAPTLARSILGSEAPFAVAAGRVLGLPTAMGVALGAAGVATAVRAHRRHERELEVAGQKLLSKALSASPLPQALELGTYPLIETPSRKELEQHLVRAGKSLTDDELMGVIAAIYSRELPAES